MPATPGVYGGASERLLANVGDTKMTPVSVIASPAVTHIKYRVEH